MTTSEETSRPERGSNTRLAVAFGMGLALPAMFLGGFFAGAAYSGGDAAAGPAPVPTVAPTTAPAEPTAAPQPPLDVKEPQPVEDPSVTLPAGVLSAGGPISTGNPDAPVTISIVEDYTCPFCASFHELTKDAVAAAVEEGRVKVQNYVVGFFGEGAYVGGNAALCAANQGAYMSMADLVYAAQPENHEPLSTKQVLKLAADPASGISDQAAFEACFKADTYRAYIDSVTSAAGAAGVPGTPTVFINGEVMDPSTFNPDAFIAIVEQAGLGG